MLRAEAINKTFGAVVALQDVALQIPRGEITGLVGDNGAGKSTLIKIISGVLTPDSGVIEFEGKAANFASPADARAQGIETVYQDLALVGNLSVWANLYLGRELTIGPKFLHILDKPAMHANTNDMLKRFVRAVPPIDESIEFLSGGQRQVVAIARAGAWGSKLILMDEPTAALGVAETKAVEDVIFGLKQQGLTILVISHNLDQIFRITDGIWVMRRGRVIGYRRDRENAAGRDRRHDHRGGGLVADRLMTATPRRWTPLVRSGAAPWRPDRLRSARRRHVHVEVDLRDVSEPGQCPAAELRDRDHRMRHDLRDHPRRL